MRSIANSSLNFDAASSSRHSTEPDFHGPSASINLQDREHNDLQSSFDKKLDQNFELRAKTMEEPVDNDKLDYLNLKSVS